MTQVLTSADVGTIFGYFVGSWVVGFGGGLIARWVAGITEKL